MKTFSKVLSMILVGVMCFGLFATSAFASEFNFNDGGDSASFAQASDFSDSFSFEGDGFSFGDGDASVASSSAAGDANSDFAFGDSTAQSSGNSFDFKGEAAQENKDGETFVFDDVVSNSETFDKPYTAADASDYKWVLNAIYTKYSGAKVEIKVDTGSIDVEPDTFTAFSYTKSPSYMNATTISDSAFIKNISSIQIKNSWLDNMPVGTYYIWGIPEYVSPAYLGYIQINEADITDTSVYPSITVSPTSYTRYTTDLSTLIAATSSGISSTGSGKYVRFGVASISGSYTHILGGSEYDLIGNSVKLTQSYLNSLSDDMYYFIGFPNASDTTTYKRSDNTFTVKTGDYDGHGVNPKTKQNWTLTSAGDYSNYAWTSGDDYLIFWSDLMALRNYTSDYTVILRYGYGAGSVPSKEVGYNQFWHFDNGNFETFALGTNFLNSLPSGVYTLQVCEMKHGWCTNTVEFRIGAKLVPIDSDKHVINSIRNLRYLCDDPIQQVYVGNIPLEYGVDYALSANRKTVTLSYEFLNKRSAGNTYTIKVLTDYGQYCSSTFQILTTAQGGASPRTGDESNLGLWAAFLLLSGTAVVILVPKLRKHDI